MRTKKDFEKNKMEIAQTALNLFYEKGYENTTITDIMNATNLSKGGMYHYFISKEKILSTAIESALKLYQPMFDKRMNEAVTFVDKILLFFLNNLPTNQLASGLMSIALNNMDSIVFLRGRESIKEIALPYMKETLEFGNETGEISVDSPESAAIFYYRLGETLFMEVEELKRKSLAEQEKKDTIERAAHTFLSILKKSLNMKEEVYETLSREIIKMVDH